MCFRSDNVANNLFISGPSNDPLFGDGHYAVPDAMDTEMTEIDLDAIQAVAGSALPSDAMDDHTVFADAFGADAFDGDAFDGDALEDTLLDGEALETASQGKKLLLPSLRSFAQHITNN